jgi:hypothetical protein
MLEAWAERTVQLREVIVAKFTTPVTCDEEVVYSCSLAMQDGQTALLKTNVAKQGENVAKFKLRVVFDEETQGS